MDIVEKVLEFNDLNQRGQGLKRLTQDQMLSRLPICLAQLKAGNSSQKSRNEIRQLLYSLYRSKRLTKTIFMNTENSKTNEPHRFRLSLADKLNLKNLNKNMALPNLSIHYTWKNIKSACNNSKFKVSAPPWINEFDLPDGSYCIADIQNYFEFIIKKQETLAENPPVQIYPSKIKNRIEIRIVISRNNETVGEYKKQC